MVSNRGRPTCTAIRRFPSFTLRPEVETKNIIIGTAGHIDHGKTLLVKAITGTDADRWEQEKKRGITMDIGFARYETGDVALHFVDLPGHEAFVRNMVAGATGIDVCLIVIAADESVMQQTREHVEILKLLRIERGIVALNKIDLVDEDTRELALMEIEEFLEREGFTGIPVYQVSAKTGEGVKELVGALTSVAEVTGRPSVEKPFRLPVDRVFTVKGFGTVITGTCIDGQMKTGNKIEVYPEGHVSRVRGLQVFGTAVDAVTPGTRVAMNIPDIATADLERGDLAGEPGSLWPTRFLDVELEVLHSAKYPLKNRTSCRLHIHTSETNVRVSSADGADILPGKTAVCQLVLSSPIAAWPGDRFILRLPSPVRTIAGGKVLMPAWRRARWKRKIDSAVCDALAREDILGAMLVEAGAAGLTPLEVRKRLGLGSSPLPETQGLASMGGDRWLLDRGEAERWLERATAWLKQRIGKNPSNWVSRQELLERWKYILGEAKGEALLSAAVEAGKIEIEGDRIKPAGHRVSLKDEQKKAWDSVAKLFSIDEWIFRAAEELEDEFGASVRDVLPLMEEEGLLLRFGGKFFTGPDTPGKLKTLLLEMKEKNPEFTIPELKVRLGITRKYAMPLLSYLDDLKWTRRTEEGRAILLKRD